MNPSTILISLLASSAAATSSTRGASAAADGAHEQSSTMMNYKDSHFQYERALSGSGDVMSFDDDFWSYDQGSMDTYWADYAIMPKKCMIL
jgi:hypothetical protein